MSEQHPYRATIPPVPDGTLRPLWSVMIPTYNGARYLRETLTSVLIQDPGADIMQIEVIDNHSTQDDPAAVVEELGRGRVGFYQQTENVGHIRNFETCLQRSRGKLIHLLHDDDYVRDGFYRKLQQAFDDNPEIGAAFCRIIYMDEQGHWQRISPLERPESGILSHWLERIAARQRLAPPSIAVRRNVYEKLGGFDRRLSYCDDWEMWVRIATQYSVWFEVEPLAVYREHRLGSRLEYSMRNNKFFQDIRNAIEIINLYLPETFASEVSNKARERYALRALEIASQIFATGNVVAAIVQTQEALKCSHSFRTIRLVVCFLLKKGARWSWWTVGARIGCVERKV